MINKPTFVWTHGEELHCQIGDHATLAVTPHKDYEGGKYVATGKSAWGISVKVGHRSTGVHGVAEDAIEAQARAERLYEPLLLILEHATYVPAEIKGTLDESDRKVDMAYVDKNGNHEGCALCGRLDVPCLHTVLEIRQAFMTLARFGWQRGAR